MMNMVELIDKNQFLAFFYPQEAYKIQGALLRYRKHVVIEGTKVCKGESLGLALLFLTTASWRCQRTKDNVAPRRKNHVFRVSEEMQSAATEGLETLIPRIARDMISAQ